MVIEFAKTVAVDFWGTIADMSPFLLFGFLVAGVLSVVVSPSFVERHLGAHSVWSLVKASIFGVPLPLCSCGVIPVSMSLHKHGASKGSTISFLLSTPQTGVDSILVTLSLLGPVFAVFRPIAAFLTGLIGGGLVELLEPSGPSRRDRPAKCEDQCCQDASRHGRTRRALQHGFVTLPRDIGRAMLLGLVVAAVLSAVVPDDYFADKLHSPLLMMVVMMFLGIPVYVCATASVPVAAVLIAKGLTPGAALVFLMTGPATNAASFVTIWNALGRTTAIAYLGSVALCALSGGVLLDYLAQDFPFEVMTRPAWMLPPVVKNLSAVVLLAVLAYAILTGYRTAEEQEGR